MRNPYDPLFNLFLSSQVLTVTAPLSELRGYSTHVRKLTSGSAHFGMEFSHYDVMNDAGQRKAIEEVTGFAPM
jgi:translation elongation factor EF-G